MKKIFLSAGLLFSILLTSTAQNTFVSQIINTVNIDSLMLTVRQLSGDTSFIFNNKTDSITSRYADSPEINKAALYIEQKFINLGLIPVEQKFNYRGFSGKNIYAFQKGTDNTKECYIICAHYDNLPPGAKNYGADDNASGVSAVIEAARLLGKHPLPYNIYYLLFDQEESGLIGSDYFAVNHDNADTIVLGTINLDMIAYDGNNDSVANIHIRPLPVKDDLKISNSILHTDSVYQIGLNLKVYSDAGPLNSDHASFWSNLMPAILFIEDDMTGDFNPKYHSIYDRINLFNKSYYHRMAKLAIGTLASFASDSSHVGLNEVYNQQNRISVYPNPSCNLITIEIFDEKSTPKTLFIYDQNGNLVLQKNTSINMNKYIIDTTDLKSGMYYFVIELMNGSRALKKILIEK